MLLACVLGVINCWLISPEISLKLSSPIGPIYTSGIAHIVLRSLRPSSQISRANPRLPDILPRLAVSAKSQIVSAETYQRAVGSNTLMEYGVGSCRGLVAPGR